MKRINALLIAALVGAAASARAEDAPEQRLWTALQPAKVGYTGRMAITRWHGPKAVAEELQVSYRPPNMYRWEFFRPDGSSGRVVVSDGEHECVRLAVPGRILRGDATKSEKHVMRPEEQWDLLLKNYQVTAAGPAVVAGRPAWKLLLEPKEAGKPREVVTVDQQTSVILELRRFKPMGETAALTRYVTFEATTPPEDLFQTNSNTQEEHGMDPDFMTYDEFVRATGSHQRVPRTLPEGFEFESADFLDVDGNRVDHFRYTDGLAVVSVFESRRPIRKPARSDAWCGHSGHQYYLIVGDAAQDILKDIGAAIR